MKLGIGSLFVAIALIVVAGSLAAQQTDLSGTWSGPTRIPNMSDNDQITLILKKAGDSYSGSVSDAMGMVNEAALENVKFENNALTFEFVVSVNGQNERVSNKLDYKDGKLVGSWWTEDGTTGPLDLTRKT